MIWVMFAVVFGLTGVALSCVYNKEMQKWKWVKPEKMGEKVDRLEVMLDGVAWAVSLAAVCVLVGIVVIAGV